MKNYDKIRLGTVFFLLFFQSTLGAASESASQIQKQITHYFNHLTTLEAQFIQTHEDGRSAEGRVILKMPHKMGMIYETPKPLTLLVMDETTLLHHDPVTHQKTYHSLKGTPLVLLLRRPFVFDASVRVLETKRHKGTVKVTLAHARHQDQGRLTLIFSEHPFQLREWQVLDVQKNRVTVALFNIQENTPLDDRLFKLPRPAKRPYE